MLANLRGTPGDAVLVNVTEIGVDCEAERQERRCQQDANGHGCPVPQLNTQRERERERDTL